MISCNFNQFFFFGGKGGGQIRLKFPEMHTQCTLQGTNLVSILGNALKTARGSLLMQTSPRNSPEAKLGTYSKNTNQR